MSGAGDHVRARRIAVHFDKLLFELTSQRGFTVLTGLYKGVPISVIAIGMVGRSRYIQVGKHNVDAGEW